MTRSSGIVVLLLAMLLLTSLQGGPPVLAQQQVGNTGIAGELLSLTDVVGPSQDAVMLSVPADSNFVLTQACIPEVSSGGSDFRLHNVAGGGTSSQVTLDNTRCQEYTPGVVFYGGDDVVFRNNDGSDTVRVLLNGILTKK